MVRVHKTVHFCVNFNFFFFNLDSHMCQVANRLASIALGREKSMWRSGGEGVLVR